MKSKQKPCQIPLVAGRTNKQCSLLPSTWDKRLRIMMSISGELLGQRFSPLISTLEELFILYVQHAFYYIDLVKERKGESDKEITAWLSCMLQSKRMTDMTRCGRMLGALPGARPEESSEVLGHASFWAPENPEERFGKRACNFFLFLFFISEPRVHGTNFLASYIN